MTNASGIPWRKRLRTEIAWSYPLHSLDEPDGQPTMQHMLQEHVQDQSGASSATRPTLRHGPNVVDIRKCMAPYRPIIPHRCVPMTVTRYPSPKAARAMANVPGGSSVSVGGSESTQQGNPDKTTSYVALLTLNNATFYIRSAMLAIAMHVLYFDVSHYPPHNLWVYMFYLTHWGHCINIWYLFCSWMCSLVHVRYDDENEAEEGALPSPSPSYDNHTKLSRLIKHTWSMYATAAPLSLAITLLYWTAIAPVSYGPETFSYVSTMEHGGICLLILMDGLCVGSVPLRAKQFVYLLGICVAYLLWSFVNFVLELGNGEWPGYDDDALYPVLHWGMETRRLSAMISGFVIVVICPVLYWMVWMLSLVSLENRCRDSSSDATENGATNGCCFAPGCCCVCSNKQCLFEGRNRPLLQVLEISKYDQETGTMYNEMCAYPTGRLA